MEMEESETGQQKQTSRKSKGGLITMPFIIANEAFEKVASYGLQPNMMFYLMNEYKMGFTNATNLMFYWSAATNFMPLIGAFVADSFLGRFLTIGLGSIASLLGTIQLWLTAIIPAARPPKCGPAQLCKRASPAQITLLLSSFGLMSIGAGGIRPCSLAFGADQLTDKNDPEKKRVLESFFGWYYASAAVSVLIALTGIVYVQDHLGWKVGFGLPVVLMFFSAVLFFLASKLYIKEGPNKSLFTGFLQVIVAAWRNRRLDFPGVGSGEYYREKGYSAAYTTPSDKLRFLNKACIIKNPRDLSPDGTPNDPWSLCTVNQVEELKALVKVIPIWSTGIIPAINLSQTSFPLLQASSMDRHITRGFQIPAGSFAMFNIITLTLWVVLYDRAILPLASKIAGKKVHLGVKLRMGIGIFLSCVAMVVSGAVEHARRKRAIAQGDVKMSALWLIPQNCLLGLSEAFNAIGQTEFYYSEFPKSMSSVASSLFGFGMAVAGLLASVVLSAVDEGTRGKTGKTSWVSGSINEGHYEYYYWLLGGMTFVNLVYFVVCSWAYGPCDDGGMVEEKVSMVGTPC
ncbi:major facilitator superfamily protein [Striga asiatica]|uniref:Major facilitator superfamily protein n=1 Tax=Striga asiatica TaxID=4170 RepID=A0A5A7R5Z9_STRAF|nr:major facilitator superfamily protein [Striga asiatica]